MATLASSSILVTQITDLKFRFACFSLLYAGLFLAVYLTKTPVLFVFSGLANFVFIGRSGPPPKPRPKVYRSRLFQYSGVAAIVCAVVLFLALMLKIPDAPARAFITGLCSDPVFMAISWAFVQSVFLVAYAKRKTDLERAENSGG